MADKEIKMTDQKPYLVRAMYDWISDNGSRVFVVVWLKHPDVRVPAQFMTKEYETFNISMEAMPDVRLDNDAISGSARFGGKAFKLVLPVDAIAGVFGPDEPMKGMGMQFNPIRPATAEEKAAIKLSDVSGDPNHAFPDTQTGDMPFGDGTSKDPLLGPPKKTESAAEGSPKKASFLKVVK